MGLVILIYYNTGILFVVIPVSDDNMVLTRSFLRHEKWENSNINTSFKSFSLSKTLSHRMHPSVHTWSSSILHSRPSNSIPLISSHSSSLDWYRSSVSQGLLLMGKWFG